MHRWLWEHIAERVSHRDELGEANQREGRGRGLFSLPWREFAANVPHGRTGTRDANAGRPSSSDFLTWPQSTSTVSRTLIVIRITLSRSHSESTAKMRWEGGTIVLKRFSLLVGLLPASCLAVDTVSIDVGADRHPISPLIYGMNFATPAQATTLRCPINRRGGNATTRYNWQLDCTSSGSDWYFLSHPEDGALPSETVDNFVSGNVGAGSQSMVTIPTIGWVAKLAPNRDDLWSFSVVKYGAQQSTEPWHPDAGNGVWLNGQPVVGNDPTDANMAVTVTYQQPWLQHLVGKFGLASQGGVGYYLLDNEPGLWQETHRDVFPIGYRMDDFWLRSRSAAAMVKDTDPSALVCGPEEWGWLGYLYSGYDFQWLGQHGWQGTPPDRGSHGNMDLVPWLLKQFATDQAQNGRRLLDVLTLHYYPQSNFGADDTSQAAQLWRNRSTRSLWDPTYVDESWINDKIDLIPRMKAWVTQQFPGTKVGVTEYNFGAEGHINGATTQADVLGIFGREGLDLATRWTTPDPGSVTFKAVQMYRNADGNGLGFGSTSVKCDVADPDNLSAFASIGGPSGPLKVMVVNKRLTGTAPVTVNVVHGTLRGTAVVYQLTSANVISHLSGVSTSPTRFALTVPAQSVTLIIAQQGPIPTGSHA